MNAVKSTLERTTLLSRLAAGCVLVAGLALATVSPAMANGNGNNDWNGHNNNSHDNGHHDNHNNNYHSEYNNRNSPYYNSRAPYAIRQNGHYYHSPAVIYRRPAPIYVAPPAPGLNIIVPLHID